MDSAKMMANQMPSTPKRSGMPLLFGVDGIWFAIIFAESIALLLTASMLLKHRLRYGY